MARVECAAAEEKLAVTARRRRRWSQFTSRGLLCLVTVVAIGLGWLSMKADHARQQRAALAALKPNWFGYDYQIMLDGTPDVGMQSKADATPPGPAILRAIYGDDVFSDVVAALCMNVSSPGAFKNLAVLEKLEWLYVSVYDVEDSDLAAIGRLTRLRVLSLPDSNISDPGLEQLSRLTRLENLDLNQAKFSGAGLAHLKQCKRLRTLNLSHVPITKAGAEAIGSLTSVEVLCAESDAAEDAEVNNEILASCSKLRGLATLKLSGRHVTDEGLRHLRGLPKLWLLEIQGSEITDDGFAHIATIPELTWLNLSGTKVTDAGLPHLRDLSKLEQLWLCKTHVADEGLGMLRLLPSLEDLDVRDCPGITDACLPYLRQLPKLRSFRCRDTQITEDGLKRIEAALPQLEIH